MRSSIIALTCLAVFTQSMAHTDAQAHLFAAIEKQDIQAVAKALAAGADTNVKRSVDGHNAKTFAFEQINVACHKPVSLIASSIAPLALLIASFLHNKTYALAAVASLGMGVGLNAYTQNTLEQEYSGIQNIVSTLRLSDIATYAGTAGLVASAWASEYYILSAVGTAGLATLYYQGAQLKVACEIYKMVDPEHELFPELA